MELWDVLSGRLNKVTGYEECILFRKRVFEADKEYQDAQATFQSFKKQYEDNLISHSRLQKEISALLERKQMWTDRDVLAFAELHRQESVLDQTVGRDRVRVKELESELDRKQAFFMETVRERYQIEQLWSEKMRSFSTFGTLVVLLGQALMLWLAQVWIEPRRRERMVSRIIEETGKIVESYHANNAALVADIDNSDSSRDGPEEVGTGHEPPDDSSGVPFDHRTGINDLLASSMWTMEFWKGFAWRALQFFLQRPDLWKGILLGGSSVAFMSSLFF